MMTRSERLYAEGLVCTWHFGNIPIIKDCNELPNLRYVESEPDALCNGKEVELDIYESTDCNMYAVVNW